MHPGLLPGSPPPEHDVDVDSLLRAVPELAFFPELGPCVPDVPAGRDPDPAGLARLDGPDLRARVLTGLVALAERAEREQSGGLAALVRILTFFLAGERAVPAADHPLLVALYLRGAARASGGDDSWAEIARAMDRWS
jgi:hypothetical protein